MGVLATAEIFLFADFRLDRREGLSRRDERGVYIPVAIGPRTLDVLGVLVEHAGNLVTKEEIMAAVWGRTVVENANLTVQISALRRILDQGHAEDSCIQTVAARGYRFVAPVSRAECAAPSPPQVSTEAQASGVLPPTSVPRVASRRDRNKLASIAAAVLVSLVASIVWSRWPVPPSPTTETPIAAGTPQPFVARPLSIVVLPFANLSNDPDQQYFADGLTEDLTTDLSRITDMLVISRNTAFTYKNNPIGSRQIGRELRVRYVLEGSVQRSGNRVRVTTQLIDAETHAHLWAERFDRDLGDLFAVQNEITRRIATALNVELIVAEAARRTDNPVARDYILRGRAAGFGKPQTRDSYAEAINMFEHALALDPRSADAQSWLGLALVVRAMDFQPSSAYGDLEYAERLIAQALASSPRSALAHFAKAQFLRATSQCEAAIPEYEKVLALNRNWVNALAHIGRCKMFIGPIEEVIPAQEEAIRLSPRDPLIAVYYWRIGQTHLLQSQIPEAIAWLEKARSGNPGLHYLHGSLAAAYALNGEAQPAAAALTEARRLSERPFYSSLANARKFYSVSPNMLPLYEENYIAGLRLAGLPEE